ncbi:MAG: hypothetical protein ACFCD0_15730 [Gemmataceae bacterium]
MSREDRYEGEDRYRRDPDDYPDRWDDDYDRRMRRRRRYDDREGERDVETLNLISILHFVFGGITCFFGLIPIIYVIGGIMMLNGAGGAPIPPPELRFFAFIIIFVGIAMVTLAQLMGILAIISGMKIRARQSRVFSLVVAGLACLQVPLGTGLGVFTFVTLSKDSVRRMYEQAA